MYTYICIYIHTQTAMANQDKVDRYQNGCDKIASTKVMVEQLQMEIRKL